MVHLGWLRLQDYKYRVPYTIITTPNNSTNTRNLLLSEVVAFFCLGDILTVLIGWVFQHPT